MFRSVTTTITGLAAKQVQALLVKKQRLPKVRGIEAVTRLLTNTVSVKLVVLTGGFGCNRFLQQEFSARFHAMMHFTSSDG